MQSLLPNAKSATRNNFTQSLERSCYLTCGPRWARNRGLSRARAARGRQNLERGKFLSVGLPSLKSPCGPPNHPGDSQKGFRRLSFLGPLSHTLGRPHQGKEK